MKIDFGDVTMNMRNLLRKMGKKKFNAGNAAGMFFLNATNPQTINLARTAMMGVGYKAQRLGNELLKKVVKKQTAKPPATVGKPPVVTQVIHFVNKKMPGNLPKKTARALLDIEDNKIVPIIRNPQTTTVDSEAVFYFPGCGSGASVLASRTRDASHAVGSGRADRAAAGLSVLRLSATRLEASTTRPSRSSRIIACCSIASRIR